MNELVLWTGWMISNQAIFIYMVQLLESDYSLWKLGAVYFVSMSLLMLVKLDYVAAQGSYTGYPLYLTLAFLVLYVYWGFKETVVKKLAVLILLYLAVGIVEAVVISGTVTLLQIDLDRLTEPDIYLGIVLIGYALTILILHAVSSVWKKHQMKQTSRSGWCFVLMLLSQVLFIVLRVFRAIELGEYLSLTGTAGMVLGIGFTAFLPVMFPKKARREEAEAHTYLWEKKQQEVAKIRHDFQNQINAACALSAAGETEAAEKLLEEMRQQIS